MELWDPLWAASKARAVYNNFTVGGAGSNYTMSYNIFAEGNYGKILFFFGIFPSTFN
jgi:hypothetical protein